MRPGLTIARLSAAAWVGAATLFVVTALREVTYPEFDSTTKDRLALLRFPAYYAFGFSLVGLAFAGAIFGARSNSTARTPRDVRPGDEREVTSTPPTSGTWRLRAAIGMLGLVLLLMLADFFVVYRPMAEMITPPGRAHPAEFRAYHRKSVWLNTADVGLCAFAALLLCWPDCRRDVR
jgi:hypothetical protein